MTPEEMQDRLRENGIDSELVTYPNPKAVGVKWQVNNIVWKYDWYGQTPQALSTCMHYLPEQAIAATVGNVGYGIQFADWCEFPPETMVGETVFDGEGNAIGWIVNATAGRSCASCPEMDNPDSYISHMQAALKWHDEHVPRPTNPRSTCVVLKGQKPPEEVLFVREGGVTHYLPEGTCQIEERHGDWYCTGCGEMVGTCDTASELCIDGNAIELWRHCPNCGRKVTE